MKKIAALLLPLIIFVGCKKFLDEKSDKRLAIPATLNDFQALLNSAGTMNANFCAAGEVSSDDYFLSVDDFNGLYYESDRRLYTWQPDYVTRSQDDAGDEWYNCYQPIYICNSVLLGLEEKGLTGTGADNIKGQALFFRAARYLDGVQIWGPAYNKQTAAKDLGMVLRLDPNMNIHSVRSSVQQTYDLIIKDLSKAVALLPEKQPGATLPTKAAALGLLARTYLFMGDYEKAMQNAENAIGKTSAEVIDFNTLDPGEDFPIPAVNEVSKETIFWGAIFYAYPVEQSVAKISSELYNLYPNDDLRKSIYFLKNTDNTYSFKGTHLGYFNLMTSLTPAELLLTIAECSARLGDLSKASDMLNQLLIKRWKTGQFTLYAFTNNGIALQTILKERRKELVMRGLRWPDIKRLNRDGYNIILIRTLNGQTFKLLPNDLRYAIAIPENVISIAGIQQNPR